MPRTNQVVVRNIDKIIIVYINYVILSLRRRKSHNSNITENLNNLQIKN